MKEKTTFFNLLGAGSGKQSKNQRVGSQSFDRHAIKKSEADTVTHTGKHTQVQIQIAM